MKINDLKVRDNISEDIIAEAIEFVAGSCFINGMYNPYYSGIAEKIAVVKYFIDGIEYEDNDTLFVAIALPEVQKLVGKFFLDPKFNKEAGIMAIVRENAKEVIEYRKQRLIHGADALELIASRIDEFGKFIADLDSAITTIANIDLSKVNPEEMVEGAKLYKTLVDNGVNLDSEGISKMIKDAVSFDTDKASQEVIDAKNAEIIDLKKKIEELKGSDGK